MEKRKVLSLLLSLMMLGSAIGAPVYADEADNEPIAEETAAEGKVELTASGTYYEQYGVYFDKSTGTITDASVEFTSFNIPEKIDGEFVTTIEDSAFKDCIEADRIILPNSITEIGYRAFENCTSLTTLTIPPNADTGGSSYRGEWIYGCTNLKSVTILDGATKIPSSAFKNCVYFNEIIIPDSVTVVESSAFQDCTQLTSLPTMNGITRIESFAFSGCSKLEELKTLPVKFESIGSNAFANCISLKNVELSGILFESIDDRAFSGCRSLKSVQLPERLSTMGYRVFENCIELESLTIPAYVDTENVTYNGEWIYGCTKLKTVTITAGAVKIPNSAFKNCVYFDNIIIPDSVVTIRK